MQNNKAKLKSLRSSAGQKYAFIPPQVAADGNPIGLERVLERVPLARSGDLSVTLECDEFTSLCPVTGQPDFGTVIIEYKPDKWLVESKSLKLYLMQFRQFGFFMEEIVQTICSELAALLEPHWLKVRGNFKPRGGIKIIPQAEFVKKP